jgi:tellurite resistance protein TerC
MMEMLMAPAMGKPVWMWLAFITIVLVLLALDLGILHRKAHEIGVKESLVTSAVYISLGLLFGGWVWLQLGAQASKEYITGFLVEKTLAMDNVFVISLIFTYFAVPLKYQHRVLFWGILGVIVLRGIMIGLGATLVAKFSWVMYIFAIFLIATGVKMLFVGDKVPDIASNPFLKWLNTVFRVTPELHGQRFFVRQQDPTTKKMVTWCTPLFIALILIEIADLIFAVDSVPAIFAITKDPYIVYTSNIFAILGLRALYFALAAIVHRFKYLKQALAVVLMFIGSKIFIADWLGLEKFPASVSLGVTVGLLAAGVIYSLYRTRNAKA